MTLTFYLGLGNPVLIFFVIFRIVVKFIIHGAIIAFVLVPVHQ